MSQLKKLQSWLSAYKKANDRFPEEKEIAFKIKELLKEDSIEVKSKSKQIYFRESQWCDYRTLALELAKNKKFVKEYAGVDLRAYIESMLAWSEKGNTSTDLGWKLAIQNWIRRAKQDGRMIMKPVLENKEKGYVNH